PAKFAKTDASTSKSAKSAKTNASTSKSPKSAMKGKLKDYKSCLKRVDKTVSFSQPMKIRSKNFGEGCSIDGDGTSENQDLKVFHLSHLIPHVNGQSIKYHKLREVVQFMVLNYGLHG
ncbi:hypothetical protein Tco_1412909, partial [Tanacetum coccineum]